MSTLDSAIDELAAEDLATVATSALAADLVAIDRALARLAGERARRIAAFDTADGGPAEGAVDTAAWLRQNCRTGGDESRSQVRVSADLRDLPATAAALAAGEIGWAHAALLAPVLTRARAVLDPQEAQELETTLLDVARVETADRVATAVRRVRFALDPGGELARADRDFRRRWLTTAVTPEGLVHIRGVLDAEGGATVLTALDAHMPPPGPDDPRSRAQVRADALVEIAGGVPSRGDLAAAAGHRPQLVLTADLATLQSAADGVNVDWKNVVLGRRGAELRWTGPIPAETARRIACDSTVMRLLLDPDGQPLHLGRARRLASPAQRVALAHRDGGCIFPRCDRPPEWCDAHHLESWADGGQTDIDKMCLLCRFHHRFTHEDGWTVARDPLGRFTVEPPGADGASGRRVPTRRRGPRAGAPLAARCERPAREAGADAGEARAP